MAGRRASSVTGILRSAKDKALQELRPSLTQMKASAQTKYGTLPSSSDLLGRIEAAASAAATAAAEKAQKAAKDAKAALTTAAEPQDPDVKRLCEIGFTPVAARLALCRAGKEDSDERPTVEQARRWLLDEANAEEIIAAEGAELWVASLQAEGSKGEGGKGEIAKGDEEAAKEVRAQPPFPSLGSEDCNPEAFLESEVPIFDAAELPTTPAAPSQHPRSPRPSSDGRGLGMGRGSFSSSWRRARRSCGTDRGRESFGAATPTPAEVEADPLLAAARGPLEAARRSSDAGARATAPAEANEAPAAPAGEARARLAAPTAKDDDGSDCSSTASADSEELEAELLKMAEEELAEGVEEVGESELPQAAPTPDGTSWDWPLSRHEKKARVDMANKHMHQLDRKVLIQALIKERLAGKANRADDDVETFYC